MRFIDTKSIMIGDTISWSTDHPKYTICHMTVIDIEEGETNFSHYDINGDAVFDGDYYPCLMLKGTVMCSDGIREDYGDKYPMALHPRGKENHILLIRRIE